MNIKKLNEGLKKYIKEDIDFENEQAAKKAASETTSQELDMPDSETIDWSEKNRQPALPMEEYEEPTDQDNDISDWEEVSD